LSNKDPLYTASGGVSTGGAMKVAAIPAFYLDDFEELIRKNRRNNKNNTRHS